VTVIEAIFAALGRACVHLVPLALVATGVLARRRLELAEVKQAMGAVARSSAAEKQALRARIRSFLALG
jgi:hypothetical protein